jgi:hypothetical protein
MRLRLVALVPASPWTQGLAVLYPPGSMIVMVTVALLLRKPVEGALMKYAKVTTVPGFSCAVLGVKLKAPLC